MTSHKSENYRASAEFDEFMKIKPPKALHGIKTEQEKYGYKVIAFLDLLGITNQIKNSDKKNQNGSDLIRKMKNIKWTFSRFFNGIESMQALYVSDSLICTCDKKDLNLAMENLATFQWKVMTEFHNLLRGAVEYGKVYVDRDGTQIIGPAYLHAYNRQEHDAIFPRVIIGKTVATSSKNKILRSEDGESFIDFIEYILQSHELDDIKKQLQDNKVYDYLENEYLTNDNVKQLRIRSKYAWTINYLKGKDVWK